jgi:hypothetical protein
MYINIKEGRRKQEFPSGERRIFSQSTYTESTQYIFSFPALLGRMMFGPEDAGPLAVGDGVEYLADLVGVGHLLVIRLSTCLTVVTA